jgi:hypothetical protein
MTKNNLVWHVQKISHFLRVIIDTLFIEKDSYGLRAEKNRALSTLHKTLEML